MKVSLLYAILFNELSNDVKEAIEFDSDHCNQLINALDWAMVNGRSLSIPHWEDKLGVEYVEKFSYIMQNWLDITIRNRYAAIAVKLSKLTQYVSKEEIDTYRIEQKLDRYMPRFDNAPRAADLTKTVSGIKQTGLYRPGFAKCAKMEFSYDIDMLVKYKEAITANVVKGMTKVMSKYSHIALDIANFKQISELVIDQVIANGNDYHYNLEYNVSDSRGRAIYGGLKRVFNPIGYKDARALLVMPAVTITSNQWQARERIYLFIAELLGFKKSSYTSKLVAGIVAFNKRQLPELDLSVEDDRDKLHEHIWLERIYAQLEELMAKGTVQWTVPIEVDASMSLAQVVGVITNDERLLDKTNIIKPQELKDPWHIDGVRRASAKAQVAVFYGSSATTSKLIKDKNKNKDKKVVIDKDEIRKLNREFNSGAFAVIKALKNALIKTSNVQSPSFSVNLWGNTFTVEVNKFKAIDSKIALYSIYNPKTSKFKRFYMHKPVRVPDYKRFTLFMATLFVHGLDSIIADRVANQAINNDEWTIAIHDAFLVSPLTSVPELYVNQLKLLHNDRVKVLSDFRTSIGCIGKKADIAFAKVQKLVKPLEQEFEPQISALK